MFRKKRCDWALHKFRPGPLLALPSIQSNNRKKPNEKTEQQLKAAEVFYLIWENCSLTD